MSENDQPPELCHVRSANIIAYAVDNRGGRMLSYLPRALTLFAFASGAGTGAVLDIERLVQGFAQLLGDIASEDV